MSSASDATITREVEQIDSDLIIRVLHSGETVLCPAEEPIDSGTLVLLPTRYGTDVGRVLGEVDEHGAARFNERKQIERVCTEEDLELHERNQQRAAEALALCRDKVEEHGLEMRLVSAHYMFDGSKLLFFFSAEARVDFRSLVRDLVSHFHIRIELRQIGVRDETRLLGGLGVCGRVLCCNSLSDKLKPVSIKMAKVQNLSLNSMKISGPCGRLLCCLEYEFDFYREEKASLPPQGARIRYDGAQFKITDVNVLTHRVRLDGNDGRVMELPACRLRYGREQERWEIVEEEPVQ